MTSWERLTSDRPDLAETAEFAISSLGRARRQQAAEGVPWRKPDLLWNERNLRQRGMSQKSASAAADPHTAPNGVYGVGVWHVGSTLAAAIFVQPGLAPPETAPLSSSQARFLFPEPDREFLNEIVAVPLPPPVEFSAPTGPGSSITIGTRHATAGAFVRRNGTFGILTAGHAAPNVGVLARTETGDAIGKVEASLCRSTTSTLSPTADVAFIGMTNRRSPKPGPGIKAMAPRDAVTVWGQRGPVSTWVQGMMKEMVVTPDTASWGEVTLTGTAVASEGDSGGPVETGDGLLVGHVVGGTPRAYSVIQDIEYQLNAIQATLA